MGNHLARSPRSSGAELLFAGTPCTVTGIQCDEGRNGGPQVKGQDLCRMGRGVGACFPRPPAKSQKGRSGSRTHTVLSAPVLLLHPGPSRLQLQESSNCIFPFCLALPPLMMVRVLEQGAWLWIPIL